MLEGCFEALVGGSDAGVEKAQVQESSRRVVKFLKDILVVQVGGLRAGGLVGGQEGGGLLLT